MKPIVHALAGIIGERHRQVIHAVVDEITVKPGEEVGLQLLPPKPSPHALLITERVNGFGGLTGERTLEEKGKAINPGQSDTEYWEPGAYQEHVRFGEKDLLGLRKLGSLSERGVTGLTSGELDWLSRAASKLDLRLKNRLQKLAWDALFVGTFVWKGITKSFGIPAGNALTAATDWSVAAAAKPFTDLWNLMTQNPVLMKYVIKEFIINPVTASYIMQSAEARDVLKNYNLTDNDINKVAKFLYPGLPPVRVVKDAYQDETIVNGRIVMGNTQYFVPTDKVLVVPDFGGTLYGLFGELQITENLNDPSATIDKPAQGLYTFVDEKGLEERESPYVKVVAGFNGGPNLIRRDDVVVISV